MSTELSTIDIGHMHFGWSTEAQVEHCRTERAENERPGIILWIGIIDIVAAVFYMAFAVHDIFLNSFSDSHGYVLPFLGFLGIVIRLHMGIGLLIGLKSDDDCKTLWYCKLWIAFQLIFLVASLVDITTAEFLFLKTSSGKREITVLVIAVGIFVYRIVSFGLMWAFINRLKSAENRTMPLEEEHEEICLAEDNANEQ